MRAVWTIAAFVGGFLIWFWLATGGVKSFGAVAAPGENSLWVVVGGYFATLLGVVLGSVYRELARMRGQGVTEIKNIRPFLRKVGRSIDFLMSLVASPLVYALILRGLGSTGLSSYIVIGIQNGFACLAITSSFLEKQQPVERVDPTPK